MTAEVETSVRLATLRLLYRVVADLNATRDLRDTLQAVVDGVVCGLGFGVAAVSTVRTDGDLEVSAVAGNSELTAAMAGQVGARARWDTILAAAEPLGALRYLPHTHPLAGAPGVPRWIPDTPITDDPEAWHPRDALLAPLNTPEGELVGVLSVDLPMDGRRPGPWQCELLGMFAGQAAIAVDNARLRSEMLRAVGRLEREQHALRASEESFRHAFEYAPSGMLMTGVRGHEEGRLLRANDALCRMLGYPVPVLRRLGLAALAHPEDRELLAAHLNLKAAPQDPQALDGGHTEVRLSDSEGVYRWVSLRTSWVADADGGPPRFVLTHVEDVEERKRREQALLQQASTDPLTGLPNGREFRSRLAERLSAAQLSYLPAYEPAACPARGFAPATGKGLALLFCDLDGFKRINDEHGHHVGDEVLVEVARRLAAAVREGDVVARLGGDEFVVLADGIADDEAHELARRLSRALVAPIPTEVGVVPLDGASFGIGWADQATGPEELLRAADAEMYVQKRKRGARVPSQAQARERRAG